MIRTIEHYNRIRQGLSFWQVVLDNGKTRTELDRVGLRTLDWADDLVANGDTAHITEIILCTPKGEAHMPIHRPNSVLKLNGGIVDLLAGGRQATFQLVGRVEDASGLCTCCIWDVLAGQLYLDVASSVHAFGAWRAGVPALGALNYSGMGVIL
jgi:hypothetical protein